jgi:hypothetical protein
MRSSQTNEVVLCGAALEVSGAGVEVDPEHDRVVGRVVQGGAQAGDRARHRAFVEVEPAGQVLAGTEAGLVLELDPELVGPALGAGPGGVPLGRRPHRDEARAGVVGRGGAHGRAAVSVGGVDAPVELVDDRSIDTGVVGRSRVRDVVGLLGAAGRGDAASGGGQNQKAANGAHGGPFRDLSLLKATVMRD